jgi:hypothetical protein
MSLFGIAFGKWRIRPRQTVYDGQQNLVLEDTIITTRLSFKRSFHVLDIEVLAML